MAVEVEQRPGMNDLPTAPSLPVDRVLSLRVRKRFAGSRGSFELDAAFEVQKQHSYPVDTYSFQLQDMPPAKLAAV